MSVEAIRTNSIRSSRPSVIFSIHAFKRPITMGGHRGGAEFVGGDTSLLERQPLCLTWSDIEA